MRRLAMPLTRVRRGSTTTYRHYDMSKKAARIARQCQQPAKCRNRVQAPAPAKLANLHKGARPKRRRDARRRSCATAGRGSGPWERGAHRRVCGSRVGKPRALHEGTRRQHADEAAHPDGSLMGSLKLPGDRGQDWVCALRHALARPPAPCPAITAYGLTKPGQERARMPRLGQPPHVFCDFATKTCSFRDDVSATSRILRMAHALTGPSGQSAGPVSK